MDDMEFDDRAPESEDLDQTALAHLKIEALLWLVCLELTSSH